VILVAVLEVVLLMLVIVGLILAACRPVVVRER
jgi:hypothetical protein